MYLWDVHNARESKGIGMIFNGTLIVQIGNFLVTYWFLNTFFLKKGYAIVEAENNDLQELHNRIRSYKQWAHDAVQKKEQVWNTYSGLLNAEKPQLDINHYKSMHIAEQSLEYIPAPPQKTVSELSALLVKKVTHD